jgi:hypothetical protein
MVVLWVWAAVEELAFRVVVADLLAVAVDQH